MIITKTPFRISFVGGGTDLKEFYEQEEGAVISTSINKYMYLAMHKSFEPKILLKYSKTELVDKPEELEHDRARQVFLKTNTKDFLELSSFADIPSKGSGLGSSSAFTAGMLKALYTYKHKNVDNKRIAEDSCEIEIDELKEPIGKQDQYACAVGGMNVLRFQKDGTVLVEPVPVSGKTKKELSDNLLMFYTGITRSAKSILSEQKKETTKKDKFKILCQMRNLVFEMRDALVAKDLSTFGELLHKNWILKKQMASGVSTPEIDKYYNKAMSLGAKGGKLLGAGGGGFFLFYCEKENQEKLKEGIGLREVPFEFDQQGTRIIFMEGEDE